MGKVMVSLRSWMIMAVAMTAMAVGYAEGGFLPDDAAVDAFAQVILESGGVIEGDLEIGGDVTSLKGLEGLVEVTGRLILNNNTEGWWNNDRPRGLGSLHGLESLEKVGGDLTLQNNPSLLSLRGLDSLKSIGGLLRLYANGNLQSLSGLESLERIGELSIEYEDALQSLAGLSNLKEIEGGVVIIMSDNLTSLEGAFEGITRLGGDLYIDGNSKLASLSGLEGLDRIEGELLIKSYQLTSLSGLDGLTHIGGNAHIKYSNLESLKGLENLTEVRGYMDIWENPNLASLDALANLERVDVSIDLGRNPKLLSEAGLESVMAVGGGYQDLNVADLSGSLLQAVASLPTDFVDEVDVLLRLEDDAAIAAVGDFVSKRGGVFSESLVITGYNVTSLENLSSLTRVDGDLYIRDTTNLTSLAGLQALAEVRGDLEIFSKGLSVYTSNTLAPFAALFGEPILQSLQSLLELGEGDFDLLLTLDSDASVSAVGDFVATTGGMFPGSLEITRNGVTSLATLETLREVRGNLYIYANQLTSLAGLESLTSVGGDLEIIHNDILSSLAGLEGLMTVGGNLGIEQQFRLASLAGLEGLTAIGKSLIILSTSNGILSSLSGLESLSQVGEDIDIAVYNIDNVDGLKDAPLAQVGGTINIDWNENSQPIRSLEALREL